VLARLTGVLLLIAFVHQPAAAESIFPDRSAQRPEDQVGSLDERTVAPQPPLRSREEIQDDIQSLESERAELLMKYASAHPDVRAVDRRLQILRKQLEMLNQAPGPAK